MIIRSKHNWLVYNFFKIYTLWKIRANFHSVNISGETTGRDLPVLLVANHISWWDGFWVMYLNMKRFRKKFHFMMLEDQLERFSFFKLTGGFSVRKGSRSILETIEHAREILHDPGNMILIFPQGEIRSLYTGTFRFEKGVEHILEGLKENVRVVLVANLVDYLSEQKPALYIYFKEIPAAGLVKDSLEEIYNEFYSGCIAEKTGIHKQL